MLASGCQPLSLASYAEAELLGRTYLDVTHPEDLVVGKEEIEAILTGEREKATFAKRYVHKNGEVRWGSVSVRLIRDANNKPLHFLTVVQDITERMRVDEALRESEAIFSAFLEHSPFYVFFKDMDIRSLRLSRNYEELLGMPLGQAIGKTMDELFPSDLAKSMMEDDKRVLKEGKCLNVVEEFHGRTYETTKFPILKDGNPFMLAGLTVDITDRKRTEKALQKSEELYRVLVDTSPDAICLFNKDFKIAMANRMAIQMLGLDSVDEIVGKNWSEFVHPRDIEKMKTRPRFKMATGLEQERRLELMRKDGTHVPVEVNLASFEDQEGRVAGIIAVARDVSERQRLEGEILEVRDREQERIGQDLHDGVCSHLAGICFMAESLAMKLRTSASEEAKNADEVSVLVREALSLVRSVSKGLSPISKLPSSFVRALGDLTQSVAKRFNVAFTFECGKREEIFDHTKATHLYRIAQEAINNAVVHGHPQRISIRVSLDGPEGSLEIEDDGIGIPFQTEKGGGMGLNIMEQRIRLIGGSMRIRSVPDRRGTLLICRFPLSD